MQIPMTKKRQQDDIVFLLVKSQINTEKTIFLLFCLVMGKKSIIYNVRCLCNVCVLRESALPLLTGLRRAKNFDTSIPLPNLWLLKRLLFWKTEQSWKSQNPQILDFFENLDFSLGGALINVFMNGYSFGLYFEEVGFVLPQKSGHNQFFSALYVYRTALIFYESRGIFERSQILGVGFPQICSNFRICFGFYFYGLFHSQSSQRGIS